MKTRSLSLHAVYSLRLFSKLLIPSVVITLLLGLTGTFVLVRFLTSQAQAALDRQLFFRAVNAETHIADEVLNLLDTVRLGTNLEGMPEAVATGDADAVGRLLAGVAAVRPSVDLVAMTHPDGTGIIELWRAGDEFSARSGTPFAGHAAVDDVLRGIVDSEGDKHAGFVVVDGTTMLAVAGPVPGSSPPAAMVAAVRMPTLTAETSQRIEAAVAVYDVAGNQLGSSGETGNVPVEGRVGAGGSPVRHMQQAADGTRLATVFAPLELRGVERGVVAVSLPADPAFAGVQGAGLRLAVLVLLALLVIIGTGALLSRLVLAQVKLLVEMKRELAEGDLSARVKVLGNDELGELARGFNVMAEQLEASYQELELRVASRTEELARLYEDAANASEARSQLFAGLSHEFRTPLFVILGHAEMMSDRRLQFPGNWREDFGRTITESAQLLMARVDELLHAAKQQSAPASRATEPVDLAELVEGLRRMMAALAQRAELTLDVDVPAGMPLVSANPTRLREIILNLVTNSIKYTPSPGSVSLTAEVRDGEIACCITDTGVGIPIEDQPRVFDAFFRVEGTEAQRGESSSGLGLALTRRLVEAHGGQISLTSEPGVGTAFTFTLPVHRQAERTSRIGRSRSSAEAPKVLA